MKSSITKIKSFTDLVAWQEAHKLVLAIYKVTKDFPKEEQFGLTSQVRRAAISVSSNIAEGFSRKSYIDKNRFYSMARGSITELQSQLLIAKDIGYIKQSKFREVADQTVVVHKLINGLLKSSQDKY